MMTRMMTLLLASSALAACTTMNDNVEIVDANDQVRAENPEIDTAIQSESEVEGAGMGQTTMELSDDPAGEPELGTYGFATDGIDGSVKPGDDFYEYANGVWADRTPIPEDKSNYGMFGALDDLSKERTRAIIQDASRDPSSRVGAAYTAYMDTATIDARGLEPIQPWLARIEAAQDFSDYSRLIAAADPMGVGGAPFGFYVGQDDGNSSRYILNAYQAGLGLPDRDYYLEDEERFVTVRSAYVDYLTDMLGFAGVAQADARARAEAILAYETQLAEVHWDRNKLGDSEATYNLTSWNEFTASAPAIDWAALTAVEGLNVDEINVMTPEPIAAGVRLAAAAPLRVLKDQMIVRSLSSYSSVLSSDIDKRDFAFFGTTLSGTPAQQERWKRGVDFVSSALRDDVGRTYAERHFPAETKAEMQQLVDNVTEAMRERIVTADWMADTTKTKAIAKLNNFTTKIGYPDRWETYEGLRMGSDAFANAMAAREWNHRDDMAKLDEPIRRWEWGMAPMTVNAYANFGQMEIVFPASILQPPFFDPYADAAINYGGIGAVIGHEISHHFDDQGAKYDANGNLDNWWTEGDLARFEERGKALIAQYDEYEIFPGANVDGEFTLGENIGDLAGLSIAYDAYKKSLNGQEAPIIDGTTGDQRFFLGWAQVWRRNYRDEELRRRLKTDTHSPSIQRVWVIRNLDAWYDAFDVQPGDDMYLAPEDRVTVW